MAPFLADNHVFEALEVFVNSQLCLVSFLLMFDYLKEFKLSDELGDINDLVVVIQALASHTGLRKLQLCGTSFGWRGCDSLVRLLNQSTELKEVAFNYMRGITNDGWHDIFVALQSTRCKLERFKIMGVEGINEHTSLWLSDALMHHSTTLKSLQFHENEGLLVVIPLLQDPNAILEELNLDSNNDYSITNEGIEVLTNVLVTNSRLKRLELRGNSSITAEGWVTFSAFLRNPNSNLEELTLDCSHHMNDTVMNTFADALTINHKLQKLDIYWCDNTPNQSKVTSIGYDTFICTLCNSSSIMSTFNSNHSLEEIDVEIYDNEDEEQLLRDFLPEELTSLLQINKENNKNQAARLKIIKTHFSGNSIRMEPLTTMAVNVRPHAIAWMAKDMHVYEFLRAMPSLLEKVEDYQLVV
jgi:hypothetical protein